MLPRVLLLYFPGSTLSNVKVIELTLPESWRLRFSPWRLSDCKVTSRSPQVSAEKRQVGHVSLPAQTTAPTQTFTLCGPPAPTQLLKGSARRASSEQVCVYPILRSYPNAPSQQPCEAGTIVISLLQMRDSKHREVK